MMQTYVLDTDFHDIYDHWFHRSSLILPTWRRRMTDGPTRAEMLLIFHRIGLLVPGRAMDGRPAVVHLADLHAGEGKFLNPCYGYGDSPILRKTATEYVRPKIAGRSHRLLSIGGQHHWLVYQNNDPLEWRSNVGDVTISEGGCMSDEAEILLSSTLDITLPLWAVDFIDAADGRFVAIDLNVSPGIKGTGINRQPGEIAALIGARLVECDGIGSGWTDLAKRI